MSHAGDGPCDFALLGHPSSYAHLVDLFLRSRPDYGRERLRRHKATIVKFLEWTPTYAIDEPVEVSMPGGRRLRGRLIVCTFLPEELQSPRQMALAYEKSVAGCDLAQTFEARVVGLGGFTSIVTDKAGRRLTHGSRTEVTSGNALTAAFALAQLDGVLARLEWRLRDRTVAVVGATGDIGRGCVLALAPRVRRLLLVGRNVGKLQALCDDLPPRVRAHVSVDARDALEASVILAATSAGRPIFREAELRPGTVVCDIGYPKTVALSRRRRPDALVVSAGLAELPEPLGIGYYTRLPSRLMYGCFTEAMVLAAARRANQGDGQSGPVTRERMEEILELACTHGFRPAPAYCGRSAISDDHVDRFLASTGRPTRAGR